MIISAAKAQEAAEVLEVGLTGLTSSALKRAYRAKTKDCHPDYHGNEKMELWSRVSWAKECLTHWLKQEPVHEPEPVTGESIGKCRACNGTGRVDVAKGRWGQPLKMQCVMCKGQGELLPMEDDGD